MYSSSTGENIFALEMGENYSNVTNTLWFKKGVRLEEKFLQRIASEQHRKVYLNV